MYKRQVNSEYLRNGFDVILCNILAEVIKDIIPDMSMCLKNNGIVILSGILNSQKDEIVKILSLNKFTLIDVSSQKDWVSITAKKLET